MFCVDQLEAPLRSDFRWWYINFQNYILLFCTSFSYIHL